jgi:hypothetical protein
LKERDLGNLIRGVAANFIEDDLKARRILRPRQPSGPLNVSHTIVCGAPGALPNQTVGHVLVVHDGLDQQHDAQHRPGSE